MGKDTDMIYDLRGDVLYERRFYVRVLFRFSSQKRFLFSCYREDIGPKYADISVKDLRLFVMRRSSAIVIPNTPIQIRGKGTTVVDIVVRDERILS